MTLTERFGDPLNDQRTFEKNHMMLWDIPAEINKAIPALPNKMYINKIMEVPLEVVFRRLIAEGVEDEILTYDGCFNVRRMRGLSTLSRHSYGIAIDLNAAYNPLVKVGVLNPRILREQYVKWSKKFLDCWRPEFICGADWTTRIDGMHFEIKL
jgi:hypothetical protein